MPTREFMDGNAYIGEIRLIAGSYPPAGWAFCEGQTIPINNYPALFAVLGTTYGGDGRTVFSLPDLRGRVPVGVGNGAPGRTQRFMGQMGGLQFVTLTTDELPAHSHSVADQCAAQIAVSVDSGDLHDPTDGSYLAAGYLQKVQTYHVENYRPTSISTPSVVLGGTQTSHPVALDSTGGDQRHLNVQPFVGIRYMIAMDAIFPPRND